MTFDFPYGREKLTFSIDDERIGAVLDPEKTETDKDGASLVEEALDSPISSEPLEVLVKDKKKIVVICSDHTRPVPNKILMPAVLKRIYRGNSSADVTILIATGCHRTTSKEELQAMLGREICEKEKIVVHDCDRNNVSIGTLPSGGDCSIDRLAAEADLLISTGFIEPHFFAGFSGGRKSILPGIAARETVVYNHCAEFIDSPYAKTGILEKNPIHEDMIWAAKKAGLAFMLNVVMDPEKRIIAAFAGDAEDAHKAGCGYCKKISSVFAKAADIVVVSNGGYPMDQNVYQAVKGMSAAETVVKPGGVIVMAAQACDGIGGEYFYNQATCGQNYDEALSEYLKKRKEDTEPDQWQTQIFLRVLKKARVIFVSDVPSETVRKFGMVPAENIDSAIKTAFESSPADTKVNIIPDGVSVITEEIE